MITGMCLNLYIDGSRGKKLHNVMGLITVTKVETRTDWRGKEKIDQSKKGKKMIITTDNIQRIEGFDSGSKIIFQDESEMIIDESLDNISEHSE